MVLVESLDEALLALSSREREDGREDADDDSVPVVSNYADGCCRIVPSLP